ITSQIISLTYQMVNLIRTEIRNPTGASSFCVASGNSWSRWFPAEAVVVFAHDRLAVARTASHSLVGLAAEFTRLVAGAFVTAWVATRWLWRGGGVHRTAV